MNTEILNKRVEEIELKAFNEITQRIKTEINNRLNKGADELLDIFEILKSNNFFNKNNDEFLNIENRLELDNWQSDLDFLKNIADYSIEVINDINLKNQYVFLNTHSEILDTYLEILGFPHIQVSKLFKSTNVSCAGFLTYLNFDSKFEKFDPENIWIFGGYDSNCFDFFKKTEWKEEASLDIEYNEWGVLMFIS